MPQPRKARSFALAVAAMFLATCSEDNSSDPTAIFVEMAGDLQTAEAQGLTSNEDLFASADALMPAINTILHPLSSGASTGPCLPEGTGGKIYTYDGIAYSGEVSAAIPQSTARFRLYELDGLGQSIPSHDIGHIDFTCFDVGSALTEVQLASGTTLVVSTNVSEINGLVTGVFRDAALTHPVPFTGSASGQRLTLSFDVSARFTASYGAMTGIGPGTIAMSVNDPDQTEDGTYIADFAVNGTGNVTVGSAALNVDSKTRAVACINSGTIDAPVFSAADTDCAPSTDGGILTVNAEQLKAMSDSYQSLRHLWLRAAWMVDLCRSLVPEAK